MPGPSPSTLSPRSHTADASLISVLRLPPLSDSRPNESRTNGEDASTRVTQPCTSITRVAPIPASASATPTATATNSPRRRAIRNSAPHAVASTRASIPPLDRVSTIAVTTSAQASHRRTVRRGRCAARITSSATMK